MSALAPAILSSNSAAETIALGKRLGAALQAGDVVVLSGDLGAGKTQFAKGVALGLGISDEITSPTFNLVLEYPILQPASTAGALQAPTAGVPEQAEDAMENNLNLLAEQAFPAGATARQPASSPDRQPDLLRHFDLYRLETSADLDDIDYFGLLEDEQAASLVEWGDKFADAMPEQYLRIVFAQKDGAARELSLAAVGQRAEQLLVSFCAEAERQ